MKSAMMLPAVYSKSTLKNQPVNFRIEAIISDGMWYSFDKWKRLAQVTDSELLAWIDNGFKQGYLIQSETGAKSYRVGYEFVKEWYRLNPIPDGMQIVDFLFPPRIWGGMTETEGFLAAPLRDICIVSFECSNRVANEITKELKGIAKVRVDRRGEYKAYGLSVSYIRKIVEDVFSRYPSSETGKVYSRNEFRRREIVDFNKAFVDSIVDFYMNFGKSLSKSQIDTIKIFLPNKDDQVAQMIIWVITAIEKFDETASVPFSGYFDSVLKKWPYDLAADCLGKDLSAFQRGRSRAISALREKFNDIEGKMSFSGAQIADEMELSESEFSELESAHKAWVKSQTATSLVWDESSEEKRGESISEIGDSDVAESDFELTNLISRAVVSAALKTGLYQDAYAIVSQLDTHEIDMGRIGELSPEFILALSDEIEMI